MRLTTKAGVALGFAAVLTIMAALGLAWSSYVACVLGTASGVRQNHAAAAAAGALLSAYQDVEAARSGYLLSGDAAALERYNAARAAVLRRIDELDAHSGGDPVRRGQVVSLRWSIDAGLAELDQGVDARRRSGFEAAARVLAAGRSGRVPEAIRHQIARIERREGERLERSVAEAADRTQATSQWAALGCCGVAAIFALVYALAVREAARNVGAISEQSMTDGLTGLWNRRYFGEALENTFELTSRQGLPLSLVLVDLDAFKAYNVTFGTAAGDEVLRVVAGLMRTGARRYDVVARFAGEEFAIILPGTEAEEATACAERIRAAVASHAWPLRPLTTSIGVASVEPGIVDASSLLSAAERALHLSKQTGRDRVTHARLGELAAAS